MAVAKCDIGRPAAPFICANGQAPPASSPPSFLFCRQTENPRRWRRRRRLPHEEEEEEEGKTDTSFQCFLCFIAAIHSGMRQHWNSNSKLISSLTEFIRLIDSNHRRNRIWLIQTQICSYSFSLSIPLTGFCFDCQLNAPNLTYSSMQDRSFVILLEYIYIFMSGFLLILTRWGGELCWMRFSGNKLLINRVESIDLNEDRNDRFALSFPSSKPPSWPLPSSLPLSLPLIKHLKTGDIHPPSRYSRIYLA